jgi:hypothetical protein
VSSDSTKAISIVGVVTLTVYQTSTDTSPVTITPAELVYLDGVTSAIQTQLNGKAASSHTHTKAQISDFSHTHTAADITSGTFAAARIPLAEYTASVASVTVAANSTAIVPWPAGVSSTDVVSMFLYNNGSTVRVFVGGYSGSGVVLFNPTASSFTFNSTNAMLRIWKLG